MFPTVSYEKLYKTINLCIRVSQSQLDFNKDGDRLLLISPEYFLIYLDQYCQNQIANMLRTYRADNRLFKNSESFVGTLIDNIKNIDEKILYQDFMWNNEKFKNKILKLNAEDSIPYINNIAGFKLQVMDYAIRDRWQAIAYMLGSKLGAGLDISDINRVVSLDSYNSIHLDIDSI